MPTAVLERGSRKVDRKVLSIFKETDYNSAKILSDIRIWKRSRMYCSWE